MPIKFYWTYLKRMEYVLDMNQRMQ